MVSARYNNFTLDQNYEPGNNDLDFFRMNWAILGPNEAPESWTCDDSKYGWDDICDCGCGINDPDCGPRTTDDECTVDNCTDGSVNSDNPTQCDESP